MQQQSNSRSQKENNKIKPKKNIIKVLRLKAGMDSLKTKKQNSRGGSLKNTTINKNYHQQANLYLV